MLTFREDCTNFYTFVNLEQKICKIINFISKIISGWQGQWRGKESDRRDGKNFGSNKFGDNRENRERGDRGNRDRGDRGNRDRENAGKFGQSVKFSNNKFGDKNNSDKKVRSFVGRE